MKAIDFKKQQLINTMNEVSRMKESGMIQISLNELNAMLNPIGLNIDMKHWYAHWYYNTSNENHYFQVTNTAIDVDGIGFANDNGFFYKNHTSKNSDLYKQYKEIRNTYFCVIDNHILSI